MYKSIKTGLLEALPHSACQVNWKLLNKICILLQAIENTYFTKAVIITWFTRSRATFTRVLKNIYLLKAIKNIWSDWYQLYDINFLKAIFQFKNINLLKTMESTWITRSLATWWLSGELLPSLLLDIIINHISWFTSSHDNYLVYQKPCNVVAVRWITALAGSPAVHSRAAGHCV